MNANKLTRMAFAVFHLEKMVLLHIDLLLEYFYPTANIELFINLTSHPIRKLLSTLSLHVSHFFSSYIKHSIISLCRQKVHDETSRDIHFGTLWNVKAEGRMKGTKKNAIRELKSNDTERQNQWTEDTSLLQQRHFKWFTRLHSVIDVIAKSPKCKQTFSLFLFALVVTRSLSLSLDYTRADKFLFDHKNENQ